ncbi:MAG: hypothetical protein L6Q78_03600 [Bacteroidia bacterium]|nr:hypothetical protein [Bacteroidia bacterium]
MSKIYAFIFVPFFLMGICLKAQDKMVMRLKGDTLLVKVTEIGTEVIKYKQWPVDSLMPIFTQPRDRVLKIIFTNGQEFKFAESEFDNAENYINQKKFAFKITPFDFLGDQFVVTAEQSLKPGRSREVSLNIIGVGVNTFEEYDKASGVALGFGYKFINTPDFYLRGMRYSHLLKGAYVKPELMLTYFSVTTTSGYSTYAPSYTYKTFEAKNSVFGYGLFLNFGKQWVFSDAVCLDLFLAPGIGKKNFTDNTVYPAGQSGSNYGGPLDDESFNLGFYGIDTDGPNFVFNYGLRLGFLTNVKLPKLKK